MTRTAVVTGGGTGIGRAIAETLIEQGLDVTITGRRKEVLEETAAAIGARAVAFDAADPAAVEGALAELPDRVDVLVNNAGGNAERRLPPIGDGDLAGLRERWLAQYDQNVISAVLVTTALTPRLADDGRVILFGSIAGARGSGAYGAAKAAVHNLAADLGARLGPRGITVNTVAPGLVEDTEFFGGTLTQERREWLNSQTFNGRAGTPGEVAATVAFLASPSAGHITGQVIHVNGGSLLGR
ncbi:SDR family NAD(P)-dependent oxidoreductase [Actinoallomurus sp. CA-150999]|uniref:SDR family NAD(P)-dependent oxidoreductase n=1 Tax=Actinoallomurus sp. CA-150999 TaxID=3239887 RepID=UPI003D8A7903